MKNVRLLCILLMLSSSGRAAGEVMSPEEQRHLISMYQYVTGQIDRPPAIASAGFEDEGRPIKCGTPVILEFWDNYDHLDPALLAATPLRQIARPIVPDYFDSPGGNIRVHFATVGVDAVYQASVDSDGDGVPDFVESVGRIADSVYDHTINVLGYPPPLADTLCADGGDERVDIYLIELGGSVFGQTWADTACGQGPSRQHSPGWVEIDNDYQEPGFGSYVNRPLDAVRVTVAHEFFHTVHFSLDTRESRALYEMSSVWMEEELYDHINDYYIWLPVFYNHPRVSLQSENAPIPYHNYASCVFPIFLSERFGRDVIRDVWIKADTFGVGDNWLMAANAALLEATGGSDSLATAVQEFAVWNYFTGRYAEWAPDDIGFSEKDNYAEIPMQEFAVYTAYPYFVSVQDNEYAPQVNAASYVQFQNLQKILTEYWECDTVVYDTFFSDSLTIDSIDTICFDSTLVIDTNFTVFLSLRDGPLLSWGISFIVQLEEEPDSSEVLSLPPVTDDVLLEIEGTHRFHSITMIVTPTSIDPGYFSPLGAEGLGHAVLDTSGTPSVAPISAVLTPYPNPAVVPLLGTGAAVEKGQNVWFRFDVPARMMGQSIYDECIYTVDVFTVAGELVRTVGAQASGEPMRGEEGLVIRFDIPWDMKNEANRDVASGVYLAYSRLHEVHNMSVLYAEGRAKVAIIR